jgi:hypothetical protein
LAWKKVTSPWTFVQLSLEALVKVTLKFNSNKKCLFCNQY